MRDMKRFTRRFFNQTFDLLTGPVYIDKNGDCLPNYMVRQMNQVTNLITVRHSKVPAETFLPRIRLTHIGTLDAVAFAMNNS